MTGLPDPRVRLLTGADGDESDLRRRLDTVTIRIVLPDQPSWHDQVLAVALVDLLGRLFPRLDLPSGGTPSHLDLPPGPPLLADRLAAAARNGGLPPVAPGPPDLTIAVGPAGPADLHTAATGWQTYTGTAASALPAGAVQCAAGPVAAACRAAAAAYRTVLADVLRLPTYTHGYASLLTYRASPDPLPEPDLPAPDRIDAALIGAGSVGGAAVYTLAHAPRLIGDLIIVDPQNLEPRNPARALLATVPAAAAEHAKADVARDALSHHTELNVTAHRTDVTAWRATLPRRAVLPPVLISVDSAASRRLIQDCLPLTTINAACAPQEATVSGHTTGNGPCVYCLYMPDVLNHDRARKRMIAAATGLDQRLVDALAVRAVPLNTAHLRSIEQHRAESPGSLARFEGRTLLELWQDHLLYGAAPAEAANGATAVVAAAFTTALAGSLLAAEALKHGHPDYAPYRLGPGTVTQHVENPYAGPAHGMVRPGQRWTGSECLCRSARRARLTTDIYNQPVTATDPAPPPGDLLGPAPATAPAAPGRWPGPRPR